MVYCQRYHIFVSFCQEFLPASLLTFLDQESICQPQQQEKLFRHVVSEYNKNARLKFKKKSVVLVI